ncbi:hypothetical protein H8957_017324, partial [Semnopithecus entellus]
MCPLEQTVLLTALSFPGQELTGAAVTPETRLWAVETVLLRKSLIAGVDEVVLRPAFLCGSHSPLPLPPRGSLRGGLRRVLDLSCHVHKLVPSRSVFLHRSLYLQLSSFSSFAGLTTTGPQPSAAGSNNASLSFPDPQDQ